MVTYEYHCDNCGNFENKEHMTAPRLTYCPKCGNPVRQVFHPAEVRWLGRFRWMKGEPEYPLDYFD